MKEIINQSTAARLLGVSRSRIGQLVSAGRFTTPTDTTGNPQSGLYLSEVKKYSRQKRGRKPKEKSPYSIGDRVLWRFVPRNAFGFVVKVNATVIKISNVKIQIEFRGGDDKIYQAWVSPSDLGAI